MPFTITINEEKVKLVDTISAEDKEFIFSLSETVILTDLVQYISNFGQKIQCEPTNFDEFAESNSAEGGDVLKLVEYLYKIITAFNESFSAVYETKEDLDD